MHISCSVPHVFHTCISLLSYESSTLLFLILSSSKLVFAAQDLVSLFVKWKNRTTEVSPPFFFLSFFLSNCRSLTGKLSTETFVSLVDKSICTLILQYICLSCVWKNQSDLLLDHNPWIFCRLCVLRGKNIYEYTILVILNRLSLFFALFQI